MNSLSECIESTHESLLESANQLDALLNVLPTDHYAERTRAINSLRGLIPEIEGLLTRCRYDEQDLFASGIDVPLPMRERERAEQEELQVLLEIVEAECWHLRAAPPIGFLCLLRGLLSRIHQHVEHENEVLKYVEAQAAAEAAALCVN